MFDAERGEGVLFGGIDRSGNAYGQHGFFDTWIWDGAGWQQRLPAHVPMGRFGHALAYDPIRRVVVMGGGIEFQNQAGTSLRPADTWLWDGVDWVQSQPTSLPFPRAYAAMAFDAVSARVILFGGLVGNLVNADTWAWNGTDWQQLAPVPSPSARYQHSMCLDTVRQRAQLIGGYGVNYANDHWEWDGSAWQQRSASAFPVGLTGSGFAHAHSRDRLVRYGGATSVASSTTYEFDGAVWLATAPPGSPPAVAEHAMFYDSWRGTVVAFGGMNGNTAAAPNTWVLADAGAASTFRYASGCLGPAGVPALVAPNRPILGTNYQLVVANLAPGSLSFMITGWGMANAYLPNITPLALPGCTLWATPDATTPLIGTNVYAFGVPNDPAFLGVPLHHQALQLELVGGVITSLSASDAVRMTMGNQ